MRKRDRSTTDEKSGKRSPAPCHTLRAPLMMALEPRFMFDGAAVLTAHAVHADHHDNVLKNTPAVHTEAARPQAAARSAAEQPQPELQTRAGLSAAARDAAPAGPAVVFIDSRVEDAAGLLKGVKSGTEVVYLKADQDGLRQIDSYLAKHHEVSSVEIVAHGSDGDLLLGTTDLNASNINTFATTLSDIGANLRAGADILVYACNTAADARGVAFVDTLAHDTGHAVAASSNVTGGGGDWTLEVTTGTITAVSALAPAAEASYRYALGTSVVSTDAQLQAAINTDNLDLVGNDTITLTSDITFAAPSDSITVAHVGTGTLTIDGGGHTIDANYLARVMTITSGHVVLENVTIEHGLVAAAGGSGGVAGGDALGAGILNAGVLTLNNVTVTANVATGGGGGGAGLTNSFGGGGGSGAGGHGGAASGSASTPYSFTSQLGLGSSGGSATFGGAGGSSGGGGLGGSSVTVGDVGGNGATAIGAGITIGGGGGGTTNSSGGSGGRGGAAAGGIYNSGTLYVVGSSAVTNNVAAGGGGGASSGFLGLSGAGGKAVGGIWDSVSGTVKMTAATYAAMTGNVAVSGHGGASNLSSTAGATPAAQVKLNTGTGIIVTNLAPPTVTSITTVGSSTNNASSEQFTVTFSQNVTGVDILDFSLTNTGTASGVITSVTGSGSVYTVTVAPALGDGTLRLDVNGYGTGIVNSSGTVLVGGYTGGQVYTLEHTPPTATSIATVGSNPNNAGTEAFTVTFSENVTGVDTTDFTLINTGTVHGTIASVTGSGSTYTVNVGGVSGDGTMHLNLNALNTGIVDAAGNGIVGGYLLGQTYGLEHTAPSVTSITTVGGSTNNASSEQFTVTFSENVFGVDALDFSLHNTGTAGGVITSVTGSGSVYTVTVGLAAGDGTMRLDVNAGASIVDAAGNSLTGGYTGGQVYTLEHTPPTATSIATVGSNPNNAGTEAFTVTFSENVTGVDTTDFTLINTGTVQGTIASVTGSGNMYTVTVNGVSGLGTMQLDLNVANTGIVDAAGNAIVGGFLTGQIYSIQPVPYVTSIDTVGNSTNNASSEQFTVTFSENVFGVTAGDFSLYDTGSAGGTIASVTGSGKTYTVTVNNVTGDGSMRLDLNSSNTGITDVFGVGVAGGYTSGQVYTLEHTPPSVTSVVAAGTSPNNYGTETFTVTFSENVTGVDASDFTLTHTGTAAGTIASVVSTGTGNTYTVTVNNVTGDGTLRLDVNASGTGITDAATNPLNGGFTTGGVITVEHTAPVITSAAVVGTSTNNAATEQFTVTFSENVTGVDVSDFTLTPTGTVAGSIASVTPTGAGNTYTVTVNNVTGDGTLRLDLNASGTGISDAAGNPISAGFTSGQLYTIEHTPPAVTSVVVVGTSPNNAGTETFTVTFSENVTGVDVSDFALTSTGNAAGSIASVTRTGTGNTYTVTVNNVTGDGTLRLDLNASGTGITDAAGNAIVGGFTGGAAVTVEHTPPAVTSVVVVGTSPNNAGTETFTVTFSENVTGVDVSDFALTSTGNAAGTIVSVASTGTGNTYTVTVNNVTGDGTLRLDLNASGTGISDAAGNPIAAGFTGGAAVTVEHTPPAVTSVVVVGASPNNASTETFTVTFSEDVTGVDVSDFTLTPTGTAAGSIASVTRTGTGNTYTVTVNNVTGDGTLRLDLNASGTGISDAAGNPIAGGFTGGAAVTVEHTPPAVTSVVVVGASPNNASTETFTVTFSEDVTGVDVSDFTLTPTGTAAGSIASVTRTGTGNTYTVTVNNVTGDGTLRLDLNASGTGISDAAGNPVAGGFTGGAAVTVEHTGPVVTAVTEVGTSPNNASTETFAVTFSENVTGVDISDFTLTPTGTVAGRIASVSGSGNSYLVSVYGVTGDGTLRLDLNASGTGIVDATGNPISAGFTAGAVISINHTPPSVSSITTVGSSPNNAGSEQFTVNFSENVTGVTTNDFVLTNGGTVTGTIASVTGSGSTYTVNVTGVAGDGTMRLDLNGNGAGITDAAGNGIGAGYTSGQSYTLEHTPPNVASINITGPATNNAGSEQFTVTFSESVSGVTAGDFVLSNTGTVAGTIASVTGSGTTYTVNVTGVTGDGTMRLDLNAMGPGVTDAAGNGIGMAYASGQTYTIEHTPPIVASIDTVAPATNNAGTETFNVTFSENVTGVTVNDFVLTPSGTVAGTIASVTPTGTGNTYAVTVNNVTGDGTLRLDLNGTGPGITDAAGNAVSTTFTSGQVYTIEHTPPAVTAISTVGNSTNSASSETFTVTFSENVTGVAAGDFALTNTGSVAGTITSVTGSGNTYTVTVAGVTGYGTMRLDLNASGTGITDAAGNGIGAGYSSGQLYTIQTPPSVASIDVVGGNPNNAATESFTVTFSENVTGVTAGDFVLATTGSVGGSIGSVTGSGSTYTVTVNGVTGDGTLRLDLNGSGPGIADSTGHALGAGFTSGQTYTIEHTPPAVTAITAVSASPNNASTETFTVNFSENVNGVSPGDFVLTNTGTVAGTVTSVTGSGSTYTVTVSGVTGDGTLRLDLNSGSTGITDAAGNVSSAGFTSGQPITVEHTAPAVAAVGVPANGTYGIGKDVDLTVNFSQAVIVDTANGTPYIDITLDGGGRVRAVYVSGSGTGVLTFRYVVASGNLDTNGIDVGAQINLGGGAIADAAGNAAVTALNGVGPTSGVLVDGVAPTVSSIDTAGATPTNADSLTYTVTFSENVSGVSAGDFVLTSTGTATGTVASVTQVNGSTYTVTVDNVAGTGTLQLDLNGGAAGAGGTGGSGTGGSGTGGSGTGGGGSGGSTITDAGGNSIGSGVVLGGTYTVDHDAPDVTSVNGPPSSTYTTGETLTYTVTFDKPVTVTTAGGTPTIGVNLDSGGTHNATYVGGSGTNTLTFQYTVGAADQSASGVTVAGNIALNGGQITDAAGNTSGLALANVPSGTGVKVNETPPSVLQPAPVTVTPAPATPAPVAATPASGGADTGDSPTMVAGLVGRLRDHIKADQTLTTGLSLPTDTLTTIDSIVVGQNTSGTDTVAIEEIVLPSGTRIPALVEPVQTVFSFTLPVSAFQFEPSAAVVVQATLTDGRALPTWMTFDPSTGTIEGMAPLGWRAPLSILITARDQNGHETMLEVQVKFSETATRTGTPSARNGASHGRPAVGKASLAAQFSRHGHHARQREINALTRFG